jgi:hypothetical protein
LIERLQQIGRLDNGTATGYARGLFIDQYRGVPRVQHAGNWVGYNAMLARFPEQRTSVAIFCNFEGAAASDLSEKVADIVLADAFKSSAPASARRTAAARSSKAKPLPFQQFQGNYFAAETETVIAVKEQQGSLILTLGATPLPLAAAGPARFEVPGYPVTVDFLVAGKKQAHELQLRIGEDTTTATQFVPATHSVEQLHGYTGVFHSPELDVSWPLVIEKGQLAVRDETHKFVAKLQPLEPAMADAFSGEVGFIRFTRTASGEITSFDLSSSRMRGIRFERQR